MYFILAALALGCGALLTAQVGSNAALGKALDSPYIPAAVNMIIGLVATVILLAIVHKPMPAMAVARNAPWWAWLGGGVLGTIYLTGNILLAPRLGAAALVGLVVTGQLMFAVLCDNYGLLGFEQHPATLWRAAGCLLMVAGVALIARF
jgi:bacterial/archaeal transporter family-2 protein